MSPNALLDALDTIADGGSGGSGVFARVKLSFGWKYFAKGFNQTDSYFEFNPLVPATVDLAKKKATEWASKNGVTNSPVKSIALTIYKETVKGRSASWQNDIVKVVGRFMEAYEKVWLPAIDKLGITQPGEFWAHIALVNDPSGRTEKLTDQKTGEERTVPAKIWVIDKIYPTEALCEKEALEHATATEASEKLPPGYTAEVWMQYKDTVIAALGNRTPAEVEKVSKDWNLPVDFLQSL